MAEDRHVGLAQDDGAGRAHPRHHGRVGAGHQVHPAGLAVQQRPAGRGREAHHVHRVLDHDRHAGQRTQRFAGGPARVDRAGIGQGIRVEEDDRVVVPVIGGDAVEERLGQRFGRNAAGKGGVRPLERHLHDVNRCSFGHEADSPVETNLNPSPFRVNRIFVAARVARAGRTRRRSSSGRPRTSPLIALAAGPTAGSPRKAAACPWRAGRSSVAGHARSRPPRWRGPPGAFP